MKSFKSASFAHPINVVPHTWHLSEEFRKNVPVEDASIGSAGIFNSGTNTLAMYMNANCLMPENKKEKYGGMRWQVPWGKSI